MLILILRLCWLTEKTLTLLDNMKEYKRMLAGIGVPPPPPPAQQEVESMQTVADTQSVLESMPQAPQIPVTVLDCFSVPQAKAMSDYIHNRCMVVTQTRGVGGWDPPVC